MLGFDSEFQQYTNGSALGVHYRSASCDCPGRVSGRDWKSWILKNVTFTLDTDPPPSAPLPVCACCGPRSLGPRLLGRSAHARAAHARSTDARTAHARSNPHSPAALPVCSLVRPTLTRAMLARPKHAHPTLTSLTLARRTRACLTLTRLTHANGVHARTAGSHSLSCREGDEPERPARRCR